MGTKENDRWGFNESSTLRFTGRHVLSIWRVVKVDNKLLQNSFEHVAFHILRQRCVPDGVVSLAEGECSWADASM